MQSTNEFSLTHCYHNGQTDTLDVVNRSHIHYYSQCGRSWHNLCITRIDPRNTRYATRRENFHVQQTQVATVLITSGAVAISEWNY